MDVVRNKEEHIRKISKDSRGLLEDKHNRDAEIATVKKGIADCSAELRDLTAKLDTFKIKEQELLLIETQLTKELELNENEIINGLYEIILSQQEGENRVEQFTEKLKEQVADGPLNVPADPVQTGTAPDPHPEIDDAMDPALGKENETPAADIPVNDDIFDVDKEKTSAIPLDVIRKAKGDEVPAGAFQAQKELEQPPFPKSVVKTTKGRVIGEYYYDPKAYRNKRHYVFSTKFFLDQLSNALAVLSVRSDQVVCSELLQMIQDAFKRISDHRMMHFEVSTGEVLNERALKELWQNVKARDYAEAARFRTRLSEKMEAVMPKYYDLLKEQMERHVSK